MTPEMRIAYIQAQTAMLNAEIAMMQAENQARENQGLAQAYGEKEFAATIANYGILSDARAWNFLICD